MSEFKDYSIPELYNAPSPLAPGKVNMKTVAIYAGISITCVIAFAVIMHYSNQSNMYALMAHSEKMNGAILAKLEQQRNEIGAAATASQELTKPIVEDSAQKEA